MHGYFVLYFQKEIRKITLHDIEKYPQILSAGIFMKKGLPYGSPFFIKTCYNPFNVSIT